jgi:hypothetical protein
MDIKPNVDHVKFAVATESKNFPIMDPENRTKNRGEVKV